MWSAVAPSARQANVSVTPCVCTMEAAVQTLTPCAPKRVSTVAQHHIKHMNVYCGELNKILCSVARGDTFQGPGDEETTMTPTLSSTLLPPVLPSLVSSTTAPPTMTATATRGPTPSADPAADACSGHPFDAFLQLKNSSIYAFRGNGRNHYRHRIPEIKKKAFTG